MMLAQVYTERNMVIKELPCVRSHPEMVRYTSQAELKVQEKWTMAK